MNPTESNPLDVFFERAKKITSLHMLTVTGLNSAAKETDRVKAVINWENVTDRPKSDAENELRITRAEQYSALAKDEIESGFSHVSEQAIVMLWGALEVLVY